MRRSHLFFTTRCLAIAGCVLPALATAADLDKARDLLNQQQYQASAAEANQYLSENPGDTQARFIRGLALARAGKVDEAIELFRELADEYPKLAEPRNNLGVLYAQQGKFELAREALTEAVKINPEHGPAQENLGDVHVALARNAFEKASGLEENNVAVREKRARLQALLEAPRAEDPNSQTAKAPSQPAPALKPRSEPAAQANTQAEPTRTPTSSSRSPGSAEDQAVTAALIWARAWSEQDVSGYLDAYSEDFQPASGQSFRAWKNERRQRVSSPNSIQVELSDFEVNRVGDGRYIVSFLQRYASDNYQDRERKALLLSGADKGWKILREDSPSAVQRYASDSSNRDRRAAYSSTENDTYSVNTNTVAAQGNELNNSDETAAVRALVQDWAQAWSAQNLDGYFAAYSNSFQPEEGQTLAAWIRERQERISSPDDIRVRIDDLKVVATGADTAEARFSQYYRSGSYQDRVNKTLQLRNEARGWHITREISE